MAKRINNQTIAKNIAQSEKYVDTLLYVKEIDSFFVYQKDKGYYKILDDDAIEQLIIEYHEEEIPDQNLTRNIIKDLRYFLQKFCYQKMEKVEHKYLAFNDKLLNLHTLELEDKNESKQVFHYIDVDSDKLDNPTPLFDKFLSEVLVFEDRKPDRELAMVLEEMLGYYLIPDLSKGVVFFLVGKGANGKSVLINLIEDIIGREYISAASIQMLTVDKFTAASLIGKRLNVCNEEESKYLKSDRFKALVTGDAIQVQRKFGPPFLCRLNAKYLFATNQMPKFDSFNIGVQRRIKMIPFNRTFGEKEQDHTLITKLRSEISGIVGRAIKGAKRFREQNKSFTPSIQMVDLMSDFEGSISSVSAFLTDQFEFNSTSFISSQEFYGLYVRWCKANGKKSLARENVGKELNRIYDQDQLNTRCYVEFTKKTQRGYRLSRRKDAEEIDNEFIGGQ